MQEHELPTFGVLYAMSEACMQATAYIEGGGSEGYLLRSTATSVSFPGYLAVYPPRTSAGLLTCYLVFSQPLQAISHCSFPCNWQHQRAQAHIPERRLFTLYLCCERTRPLETAASVLRGKP